MRKKFVGCIIALTMGLSIKAMDKDFIQKGSGMSRLEFIAAIQNLNSDQISGNLSEAGQECSFVQDDYDSLQFLISRVEILKCCERTYSEQIKINEGKKSITNLSESQEKIGQVQIRIDEVKNNCRENIIRESKYTQRLQGNYDIREPEEALGDISNETMNLIKRWEERIQILEGYSRSRTFVFQSVLSSNSEALKRKDSKKK